jgi:MinD superfamily P-loop ATPase
VHACLDPAEENSGKLVSLVRKEARNLADREGLRYIIVDGPPGIGCPVISSITGSALVVIVTEPTVSGFHDCERVAALARHFGIRAAAVINKYDLNLEATRRAEAFFEEEGIVLLGKIPYGLEVSRAIAHGELVVDAEDSQVARELRAVGSALQGLLEGIGSEAAASKQKRA